MIGILKIGHLGNIVHQQTDYIWAPSVTDAESISPHLTRVLRSVATKHRLHAECNSLIQDVVVEPSLPCPCVSLRFISSILFSSNQTLARSRLRSGVASSPSWVRLAVIVDLCKLFLRWFPPSQLVWLGGLKMLWAVIVFRFTALNQPLLFRCNRCS